VLFPYARRHIAGFVRDHASDAQVRAHLDEARALAGLTDAGDERVVAELVAWIDEDRKATPLKALQGLIWEHGYRTGDFTGHVYVDAVEALRRWRDRGIALYVYSSGSVHAQKLLFAHTRFGDLTPLFSGWFDTRIGAKVDAGSYRRIVEEIGVPPAEVLFLSDIDRELDAAQSAGLQTWQLVRDTEPDPSAPHRQVTTFDDIAF
jgi:enolase-phosphatase E1